jgi:hypothetical protein
MAGETAGAAGAVPAAVWSLAGIGMAEADVAAGAGAGAVCDHAAGLSVTIAQTDAPTSRPARKLRIRCGATVVPDCMLSPTLYIAVSDQTRSDTRLRN